jgi:hypothetical protein
LANWVEHVPLGDGTSSFKKKIKEGDNMSEEIALKKVEAWRTSFGDLYEKRELAIKEELRNILEPVTLSGKPAVEWLMEKRARAVPLLQMLDESPRTDDEPEDTYKAGETLYPMYRSPGSILQYFRSPDRTLISRFFMWDGTPQGRDYWKALESGETLMTAEDYKYLASLL